MKKFIMFMFAIMATLSINAHNFDGINLNDSYIKVMREISIKGYTYDEALDCLKGNCQGTEIYLSFNLDDVKAKGKIGQLIVNVPMKEPNALENARMIFNVIYHLTASEGKTYTYLVDVDGTTLTLSATANGLSLVYTTPNYQKK